MTEKLRVLMVEDVPEEAELNARELRRERLDIEWRLVATRDEFLGALREFRPDLVLSDYSLPKFGALAALAVLRNERPGLPVIVVTGSIGDEAAMELIRAGAWDFVTKEHLIRLGPAVRRALARRQSEDLVRKLLAAVEQSPVSVMITDTTGALEYVNPAFTEVTGYEPEDVIGKNPRILKSGQTPAATYEDLWSTITAGRIWRGEFGNRAKDGRIYWERASIAPIRDPSGTITHYVAVKSDVTAEREAEERLRIQKETLETIVRNIPAMVIFFDPTSRPILTNPAFERTLGWTMEEARHADLMAEVFPDPEERRTAMEFIAASSGHWRDFRTRARDGRGLDTEWVSARLSNGTTIAVGREISEQRRLEDQLRQAQKMEAVGRLAGGVAHDFNNLLGIITGYSEIALRNLAAGDPLRGKIEPVLRAAERAAGLTRQLLAFSRRQTFQPRIVDLNAMVEDLGRMLHRLIGEDVKLVVLRGDHLATVRVDLGQMEQVVMNLVVNARDAMPRGGRLVIETANATAEELRDRTHDPLEAGPWVRLSITDTGEGMPPAVRERIFEPFFTTKPPGEGTGLGLSTVYGIVRQSGGHITVDSTPGKGTRFAIFLPAVTEAAGPIAGDEPPAAPPRGHETILLVEDQAVLREVLRDSLRDLGYTVLPAEDAERALEHSRGLSDIHILLCDVILPRLPGPELARRLTIARRGLRVLFMSGYTSDVLDRHGDLPREFALIDKPFTIVALARKIREVLDAGA